MHSSPFVSRICARVLLDAYGRDDTDRMKEIASEVSTLTAYYASNFAEAERLELLGGIAHEMYRSSSDGKIQETAPYLGLLLHLSNIEWGESGLTHRD